MNLFNIMTKLIYHYTNYENFEKIIKSGEIWLTERACLNDKKDSIYFLEKLEKEINDSSLDQEKRLLTNRYIEIYKQMLDCFVACFSYNDNYSRLWKDYGSEKEGDCTGVSIGLDKELLPLVKIPQPPDLDFHQDLCDLLNKHPEFQDVMSELKSKFPHKSHNEIIQDFKPSFQYLFYPPTIDDKEKFHFSEIIYDVNDSIVSKLPEKILYRLNTINDDQKINRFLSKLFRDMISTMTTFIKNPSFQSEKEVRIAVFGLRGIFGLCAYHNMDDIHPIFNSSVKKFSYIPMKFPKEAVRKILLGPCNTIPMENIERYLKTNGYHATQVMRSNRTNVYYH